ncbi:hypothetical protein KC19_1G006700 [Ceratodon purpureus]|uniref:Uncharacterized protein n=1 Tax=Ceratodon purpureus TaxID=3225 RepID=A0A8T0J3B0_CERPU|nr:hypothetical protein KC19_1G006700 [Ceratodon purpureus]
MGSHWVCLWLLQGNDALQRCPLYYCCAHHALLAVPWGWKSSMLPQMTYRRDSDLLDQALSG